MHIWSLSLFCHQLIQNGQEIIAIGISTVVVGISGHIPNVIGQHCPYEILIHICRLIGSVEVHSGECWPVQGVFHTQKHPGHIIQVCVFDTEVSAVAGCVRHILAACGHGGGSTLHQEGKQVFGDASIVSKWVVGYRNMQTRTLEVFVLLQIINNPLQTVDRGRLHTNPCVVPTLVQSCR